jgi:hypothetical protein
MQHGIRTGDTVSFYSETGYKIIGIVIYREKQFAVDRLLIEYHRFGVINMDWRDEIFVTRIKNSNEYSLTQ